MLKFVLLLTFALCCGATNSLADYQVTLLNSSVVLAAQTQHSLSFALPSCDSGLVAGTMLDVVVTPNATGSAVTVGQVSVPGCRLTRALAGQVVPRSNVQGPGILGPSGVAYRLTGLAQSNVYTVVLRQSRTLASLPSQLKTAGARTAMTANDFSRSGGMVVITVILSVLLFLLIVLLIIAVVLGNKK